MDNSRRVFRGRGGPTDRRLPKYNARRRKNPRDKTTTTSATPDTSFASEAVISLEGDVVVIHDVEKELKIDSCAPDSIVNDDKSHHHLTAHQEDDNTIMMDKYVVEIKHLCRRVKNVRESITLSSAAISESSNYEQNVLNASSNIINEWRSICKHYPSMDHSVSKATSLQVFELIQHALQCGPLAGSKAGYFKRCGGSVALMVLEFLNTGIPDHEAALKLYLTPKQADAIDRWRHNAHKAIERA